MRKNFYIDLLLIIFAMLFFSCSSSKEITNKYKTKKKSEKKIKSKKLVENFVITPYRTKINIKPNFNSNKTSHLNVWYGYNDNISQDTSNVFEMTNGFRVQILSTDNLSQAKKIKDRVLPKINQKQVYILFDPPFYKVQIGDFIVQSLADNLAFKLKQLGYGNSRIVREKVNYHH